MSAFLSSLRSKVGGSSSPVHSDPDADKASSVDDGFEKKGDVVDAAVPATNELTLQEGQAGGLGRHLGVYALPFLPPFRPRF